MTLINVALKYALFTVICNHLKVKSVMSNGIIGNVNKVVISKVIKSSVLVSI
jgi:hypothetical protein